MVRASRVGVIPLPLLFVLLAGSSAGCGGGGGSPSLAEFMDRFVAASCEYEVACGYMPDVATCVAALDELPFATLEPEIASGRFAMTPPRPASVWRTWSAPLVRRLAS